MTEDTHFITRNVFLDTQAFVEAGYNYQTQRLIAVRELSASARISVFLTSVTLREMEADIAEAAGKAIQPKPRGILGTSRLPEVVRLWTPIDANAVTRDLREQMEDFLSAVGATVLPVEDVYLQPVLEKYFDRRPPFGAGNKAEFPDALAVEALLAWCELNNSTMAVISKDAGMRACCSEMGPLYGYLTISDFLDAVTSEDAVAAILRDRIDSLWDEIEETVMVAFDDIGFHLTDEDGEVESVDGVEMEVLGRPDIIRLTPEMATIEFPARFHFEVSANYYDYANAAYDREDKIYMFRDVIETRFGTSIDRRVAVDISMQDEHFRPGAAYIDGDTWVGIRVNEDDPWT